MEQIPGRHEALCRAYTMRSLRNEGVYLFTIARIFGYSVESVQIMIKWHERLYSVMPERDHVLPVDPLREWRKIEPP
jgi:hypothetical protein